jgi:hypothetical protein
MDLDAFRAPGGRMQGALTTAMPCASSRMTQRSRRPAAAETLRGAADCVAYPRCCGLDVSLWIRLRPCALIRSQAACAATEPITRSGSSEAQAGNTADGRLSAISGDCLSLPNLLL